MSAPLLNLPSKTLNGDGSTTTFGASGNALETLEADGSSLVYAEPGSQTANSTPLWFAPAPSTTMLAACRT
jgi:hypothetical protein